MSREHETTCMYRIARRRHRGVGEEHSVHEDAGKQRCAHINLSTIVQSCTRRSVACGVTWARTNPLHRNTNAPGGSHKFTHTAVLSAHLAASSCRRVELSVGRGMDLTVLYALYMLV